MKLVATVALAVVAAGCGKSTCRNYVTQFLTTSSNNNNASRTTCVFDKGALTQTCSTAPASGGTPTATNTIIWPSLAAAVGEGNPFARSENTHQTIVAGSCTTDTVLSYDGSGRLVSTTLTTSATNCGGSNATYTAWDGSGRPTAGSANGVNSNCVGEQIAKTYDDTARTATTAITGGTNCSSGVTQATYNADGFVTQNISGNNTTTNTVVSTDKICD